MNSSFIHRAFLGLTVCLLWCCSFSAGQKTAITPGISSEDIFDKMFDAVKQVRTLRYNLYGIERVEGRYLAGNAMVKLSESPFKAYFKNTDKGIEILYPYGDDNEALVNPNGFPYFNLHLDPTGKLMRKNQHQTIARLGYDYFTSVLYHSLLQYPDAYEKYVHYVGDTVWDGKACYKIEINFTNYACTPYTITDKGETISTIAAKYYLNEYEVLSINNLSWYGDELSVGQTILLPNAYAKRTILFIRKDLNLPVVTRVYDEKGLLEEYCFRNLKVNTTIPTAELSEDYTDYHF